MCHLMTYILRYNFIQKIYKTYICPLIEFATCVYTGNLDDTRQKVYRVSIADINKLSWMFKEILDLYSVKGRLLAANLIEYSIFFIIIAL